MAGLTHRCHGNFPPRQAILFPRGVRCRAHLALEAVSSETEPTLATAEEPVPHAQSLTSSGFCDLETNHFCNRKSKAASSTSVEVENDRSVQALLKTIRIHPEAQRILGNTSVAVVRLERLNFQSVCLSSLQPVVSLIRLPSQTQAELQDDMSSNCHQEDGFSPNEEATLEVSPKYEATESGDLCQAETTPTYWTEPYCPENSPFGEPEQDSGFDCESNPDLPFILFDSGSDDEKSDPETFYLDPDPEQAVIIEVDPETEADHYTELEDETNSSYQVDHREDQRPDLCSSVKQESETGVGSEQMESEDFCAVCLNGGDLLCCDRCPKVYHLSCHVPQLINFPLGDWVCTLCRSDQEPAETYDCENTYTCGSVELPYTLSDLDQRRCEKLSLLLYCHTLSAPFHEPVSPLARNYYQIIKRPIDLSAIRRKLDKSNTLHYFTAEQFVDDILLMFKNCATFNYPDSEVAQAGRTLEVFFLSKLKEIFPDRTFPSASQDRTNKARLRWINRKRRHIFSGKKYYL